MWPQHQGPAHDERFDTACRQPIGSHPGTLGPSYGDHPSGPKMAGQPGPWGSQVTAPLHGPKPPPILKLPKDDDGDWKDGNQLVAEEVGNQLVEKYSAIATPACGALGIVFGAFGGALEGVRQKGPDFLIVWLVPLALYLGTSLLWAHGFLYRPGCCIIWTAAGVIFFAGLFWLKEANRQLYVPMSMLAIPCLLIGSLAGLYLYDEFTIFPQFYENSRLYTNVVPNQPAAAVADAGKLTFSIESFVDSEQSAGVVDETGLTYCAAPVRDGTGIRRLQFWAVGLGCCGGLGEFNCDASKDLKAKGGIVVFENNAYFTSSRYAFYEKARLKAQAQFGLQSVAAVAYVRWVSAANLDMLADQYRWNGGFLWFGFAVAALYGTYWGTVAMGPLQIDGAATETSKVSL